MAKRSSTKTTTAYPFKSINNLLDKLDSLKSLRSSKKVYLTLLIAGVLLLVIFKKSWFIAATVDGAPITNLELQSRLNQQFRNQILNQMINEKIILEEARKTGSIPADAEIDKKILELETSVGGVEILNSLLTQQAQTRITLKDQVRLQLAISKLYDKKATVSAEELAKFIEQNKMSFQATDSAKQQQEAFNLLKQQQISQIFNQKFQELRTKAKIQIF